MFVQGSAFLQLFPVVWIFLRSPGVICYDERVIPDCDSHSPPLLYFFLDASICSTMAFLLLGNSDHFVVSVSIDFARPFNEYIACE